MENQKTDKNQPKQKPFLTVSIELRTEYAQDYHKRYSSQIIGALASIDYFMSLKSDKKAEIQEWKERTQNIVLGNLNKTSEALSALIESQQLNSMEPTFPGRKEILINMKNPATRTYIEWLEKIDNLAVEIEMLWIMGVIDSNQRKKAFSQLSYATMLFARTARNFINKDRKLKNESKTEEVVEDKKED
jgi:hypothetical protein